MSSLICGDSSAAYTSFRGGGLLANYDKALTKTCVFAIIYLCKLSSLNSLYLVFKNLNSLFKNSKKKKGNEPTHVSSLPFTFSQYFCL